MREGGHGLLDAGAIGIRLDHGSGFGATHMVAQGAPVRSKGIEIDMEDTAGGVLRDAAGRVGLEGKLGQSPIRSGSLSSSARLVKRVMSAWKASCTVPVGP